MNFDCIKRYYRVYYMFFFVFLALLCVQSVIAQTKQSEKITIKVQNQAVQQVFSEINKQTGLKFFYGENIANSKQAVNLDFKDVPVQTVLDEITKQTKLSFNRENNTISVSLAKSATTTPSAARRVVTGVVVDENEESVIGANVVEKGTTNGTVTDIDGKFTLEVPSNGVLQVSYIGYNTLTVDIAGRSSLNIRLEEDAQALDEVVVVGYGTMKKSDVTGSIAVTKADEMLKAQSFSALEGLKGKASGVNVFSNSGQPGGGMRVVIRGVGTINSSTEPLYVVDGVVMENFKFLNPNDIERIEVLKDASSAAIYGARGANGVVLVTTKRGKDGEGVAVSYNGSVSMGTMASYMDVMNSQEWMEAFSISMENANRWYGKNVSTNPADYFKDPNLFRADGTPIYDTDWQKEATRTTWSHNHQLNIQHGGKNTSTGAFLNFTDQQGLLLNTYLKRLNAKLTYDAKPLKWLSTGVNVLINHTWGNEAEEGLGNKQVRRTMIEMMPFMPVQFPDGRWSSNSTITDNMRIENISNPVHALTMMKRMRYRTQLFGNASLTFHLAEGLDLMTQFGIDSHLNSMKNFYPKDLIGLASYPLGQVDLIDTRSLYWQEETYLTYKKMTEKHRLNVMAGLSWQQRTFRNSTTTAKGFSDDFFGFDNIGMATQLLPSSSLYDAWSMNSYFLRTGYTYNDRYMATVTARLDGSSRFGGNNQYGFFPSAGLGWLVSNENFMNGIDFINQLKLHTSYGITGNTEIGSYSSLATVKSESILLNNALVSSNYIANLANPDLEWEKTKQFDLGFNLHMFKNRVNVDFSYYMKHTDDLLLARPVPYSTGYKSIIDNIGSVENKGIDLMINTINVNTKDFNWNTTLNLNYNKNKIKSLGENDSDIFPGPTFVNSSATILRVGESLGAFWGYKRLGIWGEDEAEEAKKAGQNVGQPKRSSEMEILGKGLPDITGSFVNTFTYKNFDLTVDLQFVLGVDIYQQYLHSTEDRFGLSNGLSSSLYDAWSPSNPASFVPAIRYAPTDGQSTFADSGWICDGSYLRGNLLQVGYTFDANMLKKMKVSGIRAYMNVSNFFVLHSKDFKGYDPEGTSHVYDPEKGENQWGQNIFFFQYPKPRTYTLGLNVTF